MTEAGQELYVGLKQAFDLISLTADGVLRRAVPAQRLRVLACRDFASGWLAGQIGAFMVANRGVLVEIAAENNGNFREAEDFDFRIFYGHAGQHARGAFIQSDLCRWIDFPVCTKEFADLYLQPGQRITEAPYLIDNSYDVWDEWFQHAGYNPGGPRLNCTYFNDTTMCISAAASGVGLAMGNDSNQTLLMVRLGELILPFKVGVISSQHYFLFSSESKYKSNAAIAFEQWLRSSLLTYQATVLQQLSIRQIRLVDKAA
jgi:LysR family glycine cleavage system transcriptional activator/LysR family transcriptional regulator of beta-lactamase